MFLVQVNIFIAKYHKVSNDKSQIILSLARFIYLNKDMKDQFKQKFTHQLILSYESFFWNSDRAKKQAFAY